MLMITNPARTCALEAVKMVGIPNNDSQSTGASFTINLYACTHWFIDKMRFAFYAIFSASRLRRRHQQLGSDSESEEEDDEMDDTLHPGNWIDWSILDVRATSIHNTHS